MKCNNCGKNIPETLSYCPSCKMAGIQGYSSYDEKERLEINDTKNNGKIISNIGFVLAVLPYVIFFILAPLDETGFGIGAILFTILIPMLIISLVINIIGLIKEKRALAFLGLIISSLPILLIIWIASS